MKRHVTGDVWTDAKLLRAEELVAEARASTARRALRWDSRPPRRGVRVWLGAVLLAMSQRLLGSLAGRDPEAGDSSDRALFRGDRATCPVCRAPALEGSSGRRTR